MDKITDQNYKVIQYDQTIISTLLQMHGSVWPKVYPFCCINVLITFVLFYLLQHSDPKIDLTFSSSGHSFMGVVISFLVVTRATIIYDRYNQLRGLLGSIFRSSRGIVQHTYCLTSWNKTAKAKDWRLRVVYHVIVLLRITIGSLAFESTKMNTWENEDVKLMKEFGISPETPGSGFVSNIERRNANFRAPITMIYKLRVAIMSQRKSIFNDVDAEKMDIQQELKILQYVSEFFSAYNEIISIIDCQFPFPLVQMNRTFLFFWVFTLPFVLVNQGNDPIQIMVMIFFLTYGFIGIEYVSIELDDPFGDDPNDFDDEAMAQVCIDDILLNVFKVDGNHAEEFLKALCKRNMANMTSREKQIIYNAYAAPSEFEEEIFNGFS